MATYLERRLQPGEVVEYRGRPSWIYALSRAIVFTIVFIVALTFVSLTAPDTTVDPYAETSVVDMVAAVVTIAALIAAVVSAIRAFIFVKNAEYLITDRRVIGKYGFGRSQSVDVMMTNIAGFSVNQGILGHLFKFGTVWVKGGGSSRRLVGVAKPTAFQNAAYSRLEASRLLMGTAAYTLDVRIAPPEAAPSAPAVPTPPAPPAPSASAVPVAPPGWYPDGTGVVRYWDGTAWTVSAPGAPA